MKPLRRTFFLSWAHADRPLADALLARLRIQMAPSRRYAHELWRDTGIAVGEPWRAEIEAALERCDLGLLLLSPAFLASEFIGEVELRALLDETPRPIVPVVLSPVDLARHDLRGLEAFQLFRWRSPRGKELAFGECVSGARKDRFVEELFRQIEDRLDRLPPA